MADPLTRTDFEPHVGERFRILEPAPCAVLVELIEATALGQGGAGRLAAKREPFSLVFRGPPDSVLPQSLYRIEHDTLEPLDIFLVPIGPDADGMRYEAIFS